MKNKFLIFTLVLFFLDSALAMSIPMNDLKMAGSKNLKANDKTHENIEKLMKTFEDHFSPLVDRQGGKLYLVLNWESDRVIAEAKRPLPTDWEIVLHGGATRTDGLGPAEISLILCHELGHHLGGKPTASRDGWSACEGQADYWSTFECIKTFGDLLNETVVSSEAQKWCEKQSLENDKHCGKFAQTALNVTRFYGKFQPNGYPYLDTTDSSIPPRTYFGHPAPQCRLDTLMAGYLSKERPVCWFNN